MTTREQEVLELIKKNPQISQQELADTLGITRSSVAVHITNLMKKGLILGKGYLLQEQNYVVVIGGANMDIQGFSKNRFRLKDSNPGTINLSLGGVGRNIAENLAKLDVDVKLLSALGEDLHGKKILDECRKSGIDMSHCYFSTDTPTSTYLCIIDDQGDMAAAIADMEIHEKISIDFLREKSHLIQNASLVVLDTNLCSETLTFLLQSFPDTTFFLEPVSTAKSERVREHIGAFHTIKPNRLEAEALSGISIATKEDLRKAANYFLKKGVQRVFISLGEEGVYYGDPHEQSILIPPTLSVVNATGAGDAFMAALIYCHMEQIPLKETASFAAAASCLALSHEDTIHPLMNLENIERKKRELKL
ncbi:MAG: PfkB family carbohydrate kinase [Thermotaleaceae bacterium]